jgi:hypothetical protein
MMRIPLRRRDGTVRAYATVDDADFPLVSQWRWSLANGYAARRGARPARPVIYLHRELLGLMKGDGREGDHRNGDQLDNRRSNLRVVTHAENCQNHHRRSTSSAFTSAHRGVSWDRHRGSWKAQATNNGKNQFLGRFEREEDAAAAASQARAAAMPGAIERLAA